MQKSRHHFSHLQHLVLLLVCAFATLSCGSGSNASNPTAPAVESNMLQVATGVSWTAQLNRDGSVWVIGEWGWEDSAADYTRNTAVMTKVMDEVIAIEKENWGLYLIKADNSLWARGASACKPDNVTLEENYKIADNVKRMSRHGSAASWSFYIDLADQLWECDGNDAPFMVDTNLAQIEVNGDAVFALKTDGTLWYQPLSSTPPSSTPPFSGYQSENNIQLASNVTDIDAGAGFLFYLNESNELYAGGDNYSGQLGQGDRNSTSISSFQFVDTEVQKIAAGFYHGVYLKQDGSLWGVGNNFYGQLGSGEEPEFLQTFDEEDTSTVDKLSPFPIALRVVDAFAGYLQSFYIGEDGKLYAMGRNDGGILGQDVQSADESPRIRSPLETNFRFAE